MGVGGGVSKQKKRVQEVKSAGALRARGRKMRDEVMDEDEDDVDDDDDDDDDDDEDAGEKETENAVRKARGKKDSGGKEGGLKFLSDSDEFDSVEARNMLGDVTGLEGGGWEREEGQKVDVGGSGDGSGMGDGCDGEEEESGEEVSGEEVSGEEESQDEESGKVAPETEEGERELIAGEGRAVAEEEGEDEEQLLEAEAKKRRVAQLLSEIEVRVRVARVLRALLCSAASS